jgi:predicted aminopeptidase
VKRTFVASALAVALLAGCSTAGYYAQSVGGHLALVNAARPVAEVIADPATEPALKERLALTQRMRDFAVRELGLPDNASYRRYADVGRPFAVWNVVAAPELSLALEQWCFPVVGCVAYRGWFDRAQAEAYAETLRARGLEVSVYGVPAYSTLGKLPRFDWLADPLLNTFVRWNEGELARLVFHELAHQVAWAEGDTVFNESYATAVERIGGRQWLERHASDAVRAEQRAIEQRRDDFRRLVFGARAELAAVFASPRNADEKRAAKAAVMAKLRADHESTKRELWGGFSGYDPWFARANNAALGVLAAYNAQVPAFEALYAREGRDIARFHAAVQRLAAAPKTDRDAALAALAPKGE